MTFLRDTLVWATAYNTQLLFEPVDEIPNDVICATSKTSDQPAHTRSLIRASLARVFYDC